MSYKKRSVLRVIALEMTLVLLLCTLLGCEALRGVAGAQGPQGEQGLRGEQGLPGEAGADGTVVTIGENGNWYLDGVDTGVCAQGAQGPQGAQGAQGEKGEAGAPGTRVEIGANGNWYLDGRDSGIPAVGTGGGEGISLVEATEKVKASTVTVSARLSQGTSLGSGFVYDDQGHICTNRHVIDGANFVQVILPDGTAREAQIVGSNEEADVAVLRVDPTGLVPATQGDSDMLRAGDRVLAVGTPSGLSFVASATYGFVSSPDRLLPIDDDGDGSYESKLHVIQTDTPLNSGNSGGPLADAYGRVVGIVVRKLTNRENMGFALPINGVKIIADAIIATGTFTGENPIARGRTLIGMSGYGVREGYWYYYNSFTGQVTESEIQQSSSYSYAEKTGVFVSGVTGDNVIGKIAAGDIVMKVNGYAVSSTPELVDIVNLYEGGEEVTLTIWRNGAEQEVSLMLAEAALS